MAQGAFIYHVGFAFFEATNASSLRLDSETHETVFVAAYQGSLGLASRPGET